MKRFTLHFILFFLIIWLIEAVVAGSPRQSIPDLWERLSSYQLRHHLLEFPSYALFFALLLALPSLLRKGWMSWNILASASLAACAYLLSAITGMLPFFIAPPMSYIYHAEILGEAIWNYESALLVYPLLCALSLWRSRMPHWVFLIGLANYTGWYIAGAGLTLVFDGVAPSRNEMEIYTMGLLAFFLSNAALLSIALPQLHHRNISKEEQEWRQHVQDYQRQKTSFRPMCIPAPPPIPKPRIFPSRPSS